MDPRDKTLYAATHFGVFRIPEQGVPSRIADRFQDTMGFTVVDPRHFLGSGHPDPIEGRPANLGLIESTDGGETWQDLSLSGQADFHSLQAAHGQVFGYNSTSGRLMVSSDKVRWDERAEVPMADFAVSPASAELIVATTENGPAVPMSNSWRFSIRANHVSGILRFGAGRRLHIAAVRRRPGQQHGNLGCVATAGVPPTTPSHEHDTARVVATANKASMFRRISDLRRTPTPSYRSTRDGSPPQKSAKPSRDRSRDLAAQPAHPSPTTSLTRDGPPRYGKPPLGGMA